jgi:hypothetical protein
MNLLRLIFWGIAGEKISKMNTAPDRPQESDANAVRT